MATGIATDVVNRPMITKNVPVAQSRTSSVASMRDAGHLQFKRLIDRCLAVLLLIPGLPLIGLLVLLVKMTSKGPGLYPQLRVGRLGQVFTLYKIRSMREDAEASVGPTWAGIGTDSRVTRLGYWLRRLHLDELPQLFNVLRGEMSLVGPRPERPEFVRLLADQIPDYMDRLEILPGITGLAQLNLPPDTDVESVRRKLALDLEYVDSASVGLDLRILLCTLGRLVGLRCGPALTLFRVRRTVSSLASVTTRFDQSTAGPQALTAVFLSNVSEAGLSPDKSCI